MNATRTIPWTRNRTLPRVIAWLEQRMGERSKEAVIQVRSLWAHDSMSRSKKGKKR